MLSNSRRKLSLRGTSKKSYPSSKDCTYSPVPPDKMGILPFLLTASMTVLACVLNSATLYESLGSWVSMK